MEYVNQNPGQARTIGQLFGRVKITEPTVEVVSNSEKEGTLVVSPLMKGYGTTVGNALRRVMLSSLPGAAAVSIKISSGGVQALHEISSLPDVKEDVCEIVLNVKAIIARLYSDEPKTVYIDVRGKNEVTAADIAADADIEIVNPDQHIAYLSDDASFYMELTFDHGTGYVSSEGNKLKYQDGTLGLIYVDSIFSPAVKVSYTVENMRVGSNTGYDKLNLDVTTNGAITPKEAIILGAQILKEHFNLVTALSGEENCGSSVLAKSGEAVTQEHLNLTIEELDLSVRSSNCLLRNGMRTVGDIVKMTPSELKKTRNLGTKSLEEIVNKMAELGLALMEEEE